MRTLVALLLLVALPLPACAHAPPRPAAQLAGWDARHPIAARELGTWVRRHPIAARNFFEFDAHHPRAARRLCTWAIRHPMKPLQRFIVRHLGQPAFETILVTHRPAARALMGWCRRRPAAAEDLLAHPGGLWWAGNHLYASYWMMERR